MAKLVRQIRKSQKKRLTPRGEVSVKMRLEKGIRRFDSAEDGIMFLGLQDNNIFWAVHMDGEDLVECFGRLFEGDPEVGRMAAIALQAVAEDKVAKQSKKAAIFGTDGRRMN